MASRQKALAGDPRNLLLFPPASIFGEVQSDRAWREVAGPPWASVVPVPPFVAVDFESYYDGQYSLSKMPVWDYVAHPSFTATLVALELFTGQTWQRWVGRPEDAPWSDLRGLEWWSHNAGFDELVYKRLLQQGLVKFQHPDQWNCTSDLAAYLQLDRALELITPVLLNEKTDKTVRQQMRGGMALPQDQKDYAAGDARKCAWIRYLHAQRWPEMERSLSRLMRRAGYRGIFVDQALMVQARVAMVSLLRQIEQKLPWCNRHPATSPKGIGQECDQRGIPRPYSLSLDDVETVNWQRHYDKFGWLQSIRDYTKAKQVIAHVDMMRARTRRDGTVPFELIYRKAPHTARWQSGSGLRIQNLDKDPFNGFHVRHFISSRPNTKLISVDSSQIEPRVQAWSVHDRAFLDACRKGASPYDAHARTTMGWTGGDLKKLSKTDRQAAGLYAMAKARTLALGYQAGAPKFVEMARTMAGITIFENENSYTPDLKEFYRESQIKDRIKNGDTKDWVVYPPAVQSVRDYRRSSPLIVNDWYATEEALRKCVGGDYTMELPNGEVIYYFDVKEVAGNYTRSELTAWVVRQSRNPHNYKHFHGGKLVENRTQRLSREILAWFKYEIDRKLRRFGLRIEWSTHDEVNADCPTGEAESLLAATLEIMHTPPPWAPDLPVAAEGQILDHYVK